MLLLSFALVPAGAAAQFGQAGRDAQARRLYQQGVDAYNAGSFADSVAAFEQAYALSPRPLLQYNLGNAYERLERYAEAAAALRAYQTDAPIEEHATLAARIATLDDLASGGSGGGGGGSVDLMVPGIILAASGAALVAAGAVFAFLALDAGSSLTGEDSTLCTTGMDGRTFCRGEADAQLGDYETFALVADIGLIGGGVVAAAGLALIIVTAASGGGGSADSSEPEGDATQATVSPQLQIGTQGAWGGLAGSF